MQAIRTISKSYQEKNKNCIEKVELRKRLIIWPLLTLPLAMVYGRCGPCSSKKKDGKVWPLAGYVDRIWVLCFSRKFSVSFYSLPFEEDDFQKKIKRKNEYWKSSLT